MTAKTKPAIAITIGDPSGIGPEIAIKALMEKGIYDLCRPLLVGDERVLRAMIRLLNVSVEMNIIKKANHAKFEPGCIDVLHIPNIDMDRFAFGAVSAQYGLAMLEYTNKALELALQGKVDAVIGGPHTKKSVELAGISFDGYPGYVAAQTGTAVEEAFLMLVSGNFRVVNTTLHVSLREALTMVRKPLVRKAIQATHTALLKMGISRPKIAVAGLNPHAGEQGMFGREEIEEIQPAIQEAREMGIDAMGPFASDTLFIERTRNEFDAFVAMYHDQAHMPIKLIAFDHITAFTVGIPLLFCSVGHGSALDIAGKGIASPNSLLASIRLLSNAREK